MAQRGTRTFMTFNEFAEWVQVVTKELSLEVALKPPQIHAQLERWNGDIQRLAGAEQIFFASKLGDLVHVTSRGLNPAKRGWVYIDVPRVKDGALLLVELSARSDWWEDGMVKENPVSIQLYGKLSRRLKKLIKYPTWVRNIKLDDPGGPLRDFGYTEGAKEWSRNGGELMQDGVLNLRFEIRD